MRDGGRSVFDRWQEDYRQSVLLNDVLRGVKMATITESQASSMTPRAGPRSGLLPPISHDEPPEANSNGNDNNSNNNIYVQVGCKFSYNFSYELAIVAV